MKILVIAPHPDDEVLGCGGTIALHAKSDDEVSLCIVTKAYAPDWTEEFMKHRKEEVAEANKILGIKQTFFLDFPTVKLDTVPQKTLNDAISKVVTETSPELVYVPFKGDLNRDHRLVFESALVATRPNSHGPREVLAYEVLSETDWGSPIEKFIPNVYVDISSVFEAKIEAMKAYGSELRPYPSQRSLEMLRVLAQKRGSEVELNFAEAFWLIRQVRK
jgi:LmbE family N-acetylglucosaminyl deacetylase